jgi:hypothetical protein
MRVGVPWGASRGVLYEIWCVSEQGGVDLLWRSWAIERGLFWGGGVQFCAKSTK